jgi:hypothetical protein
MPLGEKRVPGLRNDLHRFGRAIASGSKESEFSLYPYQFTVQLQKRFRHGTCVGIKSRFFLVYTKTNGRLLKRAIRVWIASDCPPDWHVCKSSFDSFCEAVS